MRGTTRCVEGRWMRHDPQFDDPDLETDIGQCPECRGHGCKEKEPAVKAYDPKCYELAEYFLRSNGAATQTHVEELAQAIQDAVEDFPMPVEEFPDHGPTS